MSARASATAGPGGTVRTADGVLRLPLASDTLPPYESTNLYLIIAADRAALVDPGFRDPADVSRVARTLRDAGVRDLAMVLLTHTHGDHVAGLPALRERFGAVPVYVHPAEMDLVPGDGPVLALQHDRRLMLAGRTIRAVHTPGHAPGHLSFHLGDVGGVLCGDLLTAEGSTWVGLPEGDAEAYLESLNAVQALDPDWIGPAHGPEARSAGDAIGRARRRRSDRERQIEEALDEPLDLSTLRERVYGAVPEDARKVVEASLLAHLARLMRTMRVVHLGTGPEGPFRRTR